MVQAPDESRDTRLDCENPQGSGRFLSRIPAARPSMRQYTRPGKDSSAQGERLKPLMRLLDAKSAARSGLFRTGVLISVERSESLELAEASAGDRGQSRTRAIALRAIALLFRPRLLYADGNLD